MIADDKNEPNKKWMKALNRFFLNLDGIVSGEYLRVNYNRSVSGIRHFWICYPETCYHKISLLTDLLLTEFVVGS